MIDSEGYRANVGIILCNGDGKLLWARRCGQNAWQFPQGGIQRNESPRQALFRELWEEVGLRPDDVQIIGESKNWLRYQLPKRYIRRHSKPLCIGQKQRWFLLRMLSEDRKVKLNCSDHPEFDHWCWVSYWRPLDEIIFFKRKVYEKALKEFEPLLSNLKVVPSQSHSGVKS